MIAHASPTLPNALAAIVAEQHVIADPAACALYAVQGVVPTCVVTPGSLEELSAVMQVAYERRAAVVGAARAANSVKEKAEIVSVRWKLARVVST